MRCTKVVFHLNNIDAGYTIRASDIRTLLERDNSSHCVCWDVLKINSVSPLTILLDCLEVRILWMNLFHIRIHISHWRNGKLLKTEMDCFFSHNEILSILLWNEDKRCNQFIPAKRRLSIPVWASVSYFIKLTEIMNFQPLLCFKVEPFLWYISSSGNNHSYINDSRSNVFFSL